MTSSLPQFEYKGKAAHKIQHLLCRDPFCVTLSPALSITVIPHTVMAGTGRAGGVGGVPDSIILARFAVPGLVVGGLINLSHHNRAAVYRDWKEDRRTVDAPNLLYLHHMMWCKYVM